jgi:hypothetical protein
MSALAEARVGIKSRVRVRIVEGYGLDVILLKCSRQPVTGPARSRRKSIRPPKYTC